MSVWEVVGGGDKGGILVREGQGLKSPEAPERLSTGALVREVGLIGERLNYWRLTGTGPETGWVSIALKGKDLLSKTDKAAEAQTEREAAAPLLVCFYSGGFTPAQGKDQLKDFLTCASAAGLKDHLVLDNYPAAPYDGCATFVEYTGKLAEKIDEHPANRDRSVVIFAHSLGVQAAAGLARQLGSRVLKAYMIASRPGFVSFKDVWGVNNFREFDSLQDNQMLDAATSAWPSNFLGSFAGRDASKLPPIVKTVIDMMRKQYGSEFMAYAVGDEGVGASAEELSFSAPVLAVCCSEEKKTGETSRKVAQWKEMTSGSFEMATIGGGHFDCLSSSELFKLVLDDVNKLW